VTTISAALQKARQSIETSEARLLLRHVLACSAAHIAAHPDLAAKAKRMTQLKGGGPVLAATVLAYLPELGKIEDKM